MYVGMSCKIYNKLSIEHVISNLVSKFFTQVGFEQGDMTLTVWIVNVISIKVWLLLPRKHAIYLFEVKLANDIQKNYHSLFL